MEINFVFFQEKKNGQVLGYHRFLSVKQEEEGEKSQPKSGSKMVNLTTWDVNIRTCDFLNSI